MNTDFYRIKRLPPYIFEEVNRLKAQSRARGEDIIDFGMGNPDMPTPDFIVDKLCETARDPRAHRYSASRGIKGLRKAHVAYYKRRFGVTLDPDREVIAALGLQGRLRQSGHGHHRARRCGAGAQSRLSDPCLRLHDRGRRHPACPGHQPGGISFQDRHRDAPFGAVAAGDGGELSLQSHGPGGGAGFL